MILFNRNVRYDIYKFDDFGVDLVSYAPIAAYIKGEVNILDLVDEIFVLEAIPFNQQLARISRDSEGYDIKTGLTKIRLHLNSMMYPDFKYIVYSATVLYNPVNQIVRACEKAWYPIDLPYSIPEFVKIVGRTADIGYLDISQHTDLIIPVSECFRQFRLNQNYAEQVNIELGLVNLIQRVGLKKNLIVPPNATVDFKSDEKTIPSYIIAYQFTSDEWERGQTRYLGGGAYRVNWNEAVESYELEWEGQEYTGVLSDEVEVLLVGLNDNYEYEKSKDEILEVTNLAQNKLDEIEHDYNIEVTISLNNSDTINPSNIFECLGEIINLRMINGDYSAKLTAFKYDFKTKKYALTFGTKRVGTQKLIKELMRI